MISVENLRRTGPTSAIAQGEIDNNELDLLTGFWKILLARFD